MNGGVTITFDDMKELIRTEEKLRDAVKKIDSLVAEINFARQCEQDTLRKGGIDAANEIRTLVRSYDCKTHRYSSTARKVIDDVLRGIDALYPPF